MVDVFNIPDGSNNVKVFYSTGNNAWQIWNKPKNCKFVNMFLIGGGGGGTGGAGGGTSSAGGSGGGSSSITSGIFLASVLPDVLYVQVGIGGAAGLGEIGGGSGTNGGNGTLSYVSVFPSATTSSLISNTNPIVLASGNVAAGGAIYNAISSTPGTAGTAFSQSSPLFNIFSFLGIISVIGGQVGGTGGNTGASPLPSNVTISSLTSGGAGGGAWLDPNLYNGASIVGNQINPTISGGTTTGTINGNHGYSNLPTYLSGNRLPIFFTGGAGGGASNLTVGGDGGNGSYGSGGGGGGAITTNNTAGSGGRGGDGLVIITCW